MGHVTLEPIRTFTRGTETIAEIRIAGRALYIHRNEGKLYHWLGKDKLVKNAELADLAESMLKVRRPARQGTYPERQCCRCTNRFTPKGPESYVCPGCKSESMKRVAA
ncbi:MAG: hypothetical protein E6Q97_23280 [Desulfurellales bacterium]|nr:MAG: hypothetical protein E6Q97_23280 [Desulfurellales bacterium]